MKVFKRVVLPVVVLLVAAFAGIVLWGGQAIKQGVNRAGPRLMGVPISLEAVQFSPLRGHIILSGLFVGNPEGFQTESLFEISRLELDLDIKSLLTDTIRIHRILVDEAQITYEVGMGRTNLGTLLEQLESSAEEDAEPAQAEEPGKTVVIKELVLANARAQVSSTVLRGRVVPVQLSTITLNDLGGEDQSLVQITSEVLKAVLGAVGNAVAGAGDLLGDGVMSALEGAGALGGAATDGARAAAGAAAGGARAVTGAIGDGARGLRDMLGGGRDEEPGEEPEDSASEEPTVGETTDRE